MRILMLHNRYDVRGGEDESTDLEVKLLRSHGHEVTLLTEDNKKIVGFVKKLQTTFEAMWSGRWNAILRDAIRGDRPDLIHVQNYFPQMSPSVFWIANIYKIPVVHSVRNYRLSCPSANLFRDNNLCVDCVGGRVKYKSIIHACYRNSRSASSVLATMLSIHNFIGTWKSRVDGYIAVSNFVAEVLAKEGIPQERVFVKPNFSEGLQHGEILPHEKREDVVYVGRLSREKGVYELVEQFKKVSSNDRLILVGEGADDLTDFDGKIVRLGRRNITEVLSIMGKAKYVIMPGRWPEPFGRVAVEAMSVGTPVLCRPIGGLKDIIEDGVSGYNIADGRDGILMCLEKALRSESRGLLQENARRIYEAKYSPSANYERLMDIYSSVLSQR